jgi:hypothetical protein
MTIFGDLRTGLRLARSYDELITLALEAERQARLLNGLEGEGPRGASSNDVLAVLGSACALLQRAEGRAVGAALPARLPEPPAPLREPPARLPEPEPRPEPEPASDPAPVRHAARPPQAVTELIALRDMVTAASESDGAAKALAAVGRKLGHVLEREGVRALEDEGEFDYRFQEIVDVRRTADPGQDERVCETIRPGYALGERVLRPQQVVVYRLDD